MKDYNTMLTWCWFTMEDLGVAMPFCHYYLVKVRKHMPLIIHTLVFWQKKYKIATVWKESLKELIKGLFTLMNYKENLPIFYKIQTWTSQFD